MKRSRPHARNSAVPAREVLDEELNEEEKQEEADASDENGHEDGDEDDEDEDEDDDENEEDEDEEEEGQKKDGMGDMLSKILSQSVTASNPVLAKRKTAIMKEMEDDKKDRDRLKRLRTQRKTEREKQMEVPDASSADYERQLRKLATRGVVSLFNAISTAKRDEAEVHAAAAAKAAEQAKDISRVDVKRMTQANFLELLKGDEASKSNQTTGAEGDSAATGAATAAVTAIGSEGSEAKKSSSSAASSAVAKDKSWSALRDNYLLENTTTLKNWDKDSDAGDSDGDGEVDLDDAPLRSNGEVTKKKG